VIADPGVCLYLRRDALERIGRFDEKLPFPWAAADWSLRAWEIGLRVNSYPAVTVTQLAPPRDPQAPGANAFWERWRPRLEGRDVRTDDGRLRIAYVTEDTGVGGGHRVIFEHLNRLAARGHDCTLYTLDDSGPDWFDVRVPVRRFKRYEPLLAELGELRGIKVATWWNTSLPVWLASMERGVAASFVQDIETSYYPDPAWHGRVLASYREEFALVTTSGWNRDRLRELALNPEVVSPGIDLEVFRELDGVQRRDDLVVAIGRGHWIKNLDLTVDAWKALGDPPPAELRLYGSEPDTEKRFPFLPYVMRPNDEEVNHLLNEATMFVQTSQHEGFCLPPLEAMAAGCAVVCTDAHGNADFCVDGENCLMPEATVEAVAAAIRRVLEDRELRERLVANGRETVARYGWEARIDALERFYESVAPAPALSRAAS
jgi:glycosyltransferase involved in cell wall biosynthesis